jgi:hypothetical protein
VDIALITTLGTCAPPPDSKKTFPSFPSDESSAYDNDVELNDDGDKVESQK